MQEGWEREDFRNILSEQEKAVEWLMFLIKDPKGERYLLEKSQKERRREQIDHFERTRIFLDYLGNPQDKYSAVHIAGTGGKGSVTTMISRILEETGSLYML